MEAQATRAASFRNVAPIAALTLIALALRLFDIARDNYTFDAMLSLLEAAQPDPFAAGDRRLDQSHPPLYGIIFWLWARIVGTSEGEARLLTVLAGTAWVPLTYLIARHTLSRGASLALAAIIVVLPGAVMRSRFLDSYGFQVAGTLTHLASFLALTKPGTTTRREHYFRHALVVTFHLFLHHLALLLLVAENLLFFTDKRRRDGRIRPWLKLQAVHFAVVAYNFALVAARHAARYGGEAPYLTFTEMAHRLAGLYSGVWFASTHFPILERLVIDLPAQGRNPTLGLTLALITLALIAIWVFIPPRNGTLALRENTPATPLNRLYAVAPLLAFGLVPLIIFGPTGMIGRERSFGLALLGLILPATLLLYAIPRIGVALVGIPVITFAAMLPASYANDRTMFSDAAAWLTAAREKDPDTDATAFMVSSYTTFCPFMYHYDPKSPYCDFSAGRRMLPLNDDANRTYAIRVGLASDTGESDTCVTGYERAFHPRDIAPHKRIWLVLYEARWCDDEHASLRRQLAPYRLLRSQRFERLRVFHYCLEADPACRDREPDPTSLDPWGHPPDFENSQATR